MRTAAAGLVIVVASFAAGCGAERARPPGGRFLVYTKDLDGSTQSVWLARPDGTHARPLVRDGIFGALSPDGRWVVYSRCLASRVRCRTGEAPFALFLVATTGGKPRLLAR